MLKRKAFTLIELLVVIAIIGILTTIAVVALNNARAKARDVKRVADVKQVQTALELFFNDKGRYPTTDEWDSGSIYSTSSNGTTTYMATIPSASTPPDGGCSAGQNIFAYDVSPDGTSYTVSYCTGGPVSSLDVGPKCATPSGMLDRSCFVCGDTITDSRDSNIYNTVLIDTQCWLASDLAYLPSVVPSTTGSNTNPYYYVYDYQGTDTNAAKLEASYTTYGALYNHPAALTACPYGWHLPSDTEWYALEAYLDTNVGTKLKAAAPDWNGDNSSAFNALPAGFRTTGGAFANQGSYIQLWLTPFSGSDASNFWLYTGGTGAAFSNDTREYGFSVRCLKN